MAPISRWREEPKEKSAKWRTVCSVIAQQASSHTRVAHPARADRQAGEREVLLRAVEDRVQPRAELGERARVAGELAVHAVGGERDLQQHRAGDQPPALAGGERRRRRARPISTRDGRDLVGREPAMRAPAGDVARVGRDEEGREEAVAGLDGRVEQDLVLVVVDDPLGGRSTAAGESGRAQNSRRRWLTPTCVPARTSPTSSSEGTSSGAAATRSRSRASSSSREHGVLGGAQLGLVRPSSSSSIDGRLVLGVVVLVRVLGARLGALRRPPQREAPHRLLARRAPRASRPGGAAASSASRAADAASAARSAAATLSTPRNEPVGRWTAW